MRFLLLLLLGLCSCVVRVVVRLSWYPMWWGVVVVVTVMRELFVLDVSMLRECEGVDNAGVGVITVSAVVHTHGSGIMSSAADVLWMSVVRGMRVGGVCEMCMARGGVGGEG